MKQAFRVFAGASIAVLTLTACAKTTPTGAPLLPGQTPTVVLPSAAPNAPCNNEYFPARKGATWTYASSGSPSGAFSFRKGIDEVRPDQFSVGVNVNGKTIHETWLCQPEGLVAQSMVLMDAASLLALDKFSELQVTNVSGLNMPPDITAGASWSISYDVQGAEKDQTGAVIATMTGQVIISYTATGKESVTVPAGSFEAMAVSVSSVINFSVVQAGGTSNISVNSDYIAWFAAGVGWVKSSGTGTLGSSEYFETIELQAFSIP